MRTVRSTKAPGALRCRNGEKKSKRKKKTKVNSERNEGSKNKEKQYIEEELRLKGFGSLFIIYFFAFDGNRL